MGKRVCEKLITAGGDFIRVGAVDVRAAAGKRYERGLTCVAGHGVPGVLLPSQARICGDALIILGREEKSPPAGFSYRSLYLSGDYGINFSLRRQPCQQ